MGAMSGRRGCTGRGARRVWRPSPRRGQPFFFPPPTQAMRPSLMVTFTVLLPPSFHQLHSSFRSKRCLNIRS